MYLIFGVVYLYLYGVFDILDGFILAFWFGFGCTHQFKLVPASDAEEEDSGQNKKLQSNCLDAVKFAFLSDPGGPIYGSACLSLSN